MEAKLDNKVEVELKYKPKKKNNELIYIILTILSIAFLAPIFIVLYNSFKGKLYISRAPFALPNKVTFSGLQNYIGGIEKTGFLAAFGYSVFITVCSTAVIVLFTSMTAWYVTRVNSKICKIIYYFCVFSMVVPFQMVMYTLSKTADKLHLNSPVGILVVYLGFGAGLAIFMFSGFVKGIPIEVEEAASVDGAGPLRTYFGVVVPIMKPTIISVGILETMWIWNDYLLPYLIFSGTNYRTIPIHIQYLNGSYGQTDMGAIMSLIIISILPIIIFYFACQKYIIEGVVAGAVKG